MKRPPVKPSEHLAQIARTAAKNAKQAAIVEFLRVRNEIQRQIYEENLERALQKPPGFLERLLG